MKFILTVNYQKIFEYAGILNIKTDEQIGFIKFPQEDVTYFFHR